MFVKAAVIAAAVTLSGSWAAQAQNFLGMDIGRMNQTWAQGQNAQMADQNQQMIQAGLSDPQVMAGYRAGICGPGLTPVQYVQKYMATGGCSPQGYARYDQTTNEIGRAEGVARDGYYRSIDRSRAAYGAYAGGYAANQQEIGRVMTGTQTYVDPNSGRNLQLGYLQPGQTYYDNATGNSYAMAPNGQYYAIDAYGRTTPIYPAARAPR
ncbi:MAG TPA: hypothetical protein VGM87_25925 [Roseomonas sp.]|jgi:hypothetical protein